METECEHSDRNGWQDGTRGPAGVAKRIQHAAPADRDACDHKRRDGDEHEATEETVDAIYSLEREERNEHASEAREERIRCDQIHSREELGDQRADASDARNDEGEAESGVDDGDDTAKCRPQGARRKSREADFVDASALHGGEAELGDKDD